MDHKSKKQILKLLLSEITGNFGSSILSFIIGLSILKNTSSILNFGFSQIIGPIISLVLLPFVGSITDKYNKKYIIVVAQSFSILSLFIYSQVISNDISSNLIYTYCLIVSLKISDRFLTNSFTAGVSQIVLEQDIQKYKSISQSISPFIGIVSPVVSAFLYSRLSIVKFVYIEIIIELITLIIVLTIDFQFVDKEKNTEIQNSNVFKLFREGILFVSKSNILKFMIIFSAIINFVFSSLSLGFPIVLVKQLKFSDTMYGLVMSSFSFGMIASSIFLSTRNKEIKHPIKKAVIYVIVISFIMMFLGGVLIFNFSLKTYYILIILIVLLMSFFMVLTNIPMSVWLLKAVPFDYQGRVFSIIDTISQILIPIGILLYSFLFENFRSGLIYIFSGIIVIFLCKFIPIFLKADLKTEKI